MPDLKPRVGYTDLQQMPEDGRRYELYDGEVTVVPSPLPIHQIVADNLIVLLRRFAERQSGVAISSPLDIVFSEYDVLQPDIVCDTLVSATLPDFVCPAEDVFRSPWD